MVFEGFERLRINTKEAEIETVKKGGGPPLLLVHGYPQTMAGHDRGGRVACSTRLTGTGRMPNVVT